MRRVRLPCLVAAILTVLYFIGFAALLLQTTSSNRTAVLVSKDVSIVAACSSRESFLRYSLPSWQNVGGVKEIILVDWTPSNTSRDWLVTHANNDPKLKPVLVAAESEWSLSRAYNLAVTLASAPLILKVDCDHLLAGDFIEKHPFNTSEDSAFYAGDWQLATTENEIHLSGIVFLPRNAFLRVGGYDERIRGYGWDDSDLYTRLVLNGLQRRNISIDRSFHLCHSDQLRHSGGRTRFPDVETQVNRILAEHMHPWNSTLMESWEVVRSERILFAKSLSRHSFYVSASTVDAALKTAYGIILSKPPINLPWRLLLRATVADLALLLTMYRNTMDRLLIVHARNGLGNRLRAVASALQAAKWSKRGLVIIWESDQHLSVRLELLLTSLEPDSGLPAQLSFYDRTLFKPAFFDLYNYMDHEGGQKGAFIDLESPRHIVISSAFLLNSSALNLNGYNTILQNFQPISLIKDRVTELSASFALSDALCAHVRMMDPREELIDKHEYTSTDLELLVRFRKISQPFNFAMMLRRYLEVLTNISCLFVSADLPDRVLPILKRELPGTRVCTVNGSCTDRTEHCVQTAFTELLLLARCKRAFIGSAWSSFSELAVALGARWLANSRAQAEEQTPLPRHVNFTCRAAGKHVLFLHHGRVGSTVLINMLKVGTSWRLAPTEPQELLNSDINGGIRFPEGKGYLEYVCSKLQPNKRNIMSVKYEHFEPKHVGGIDVIAFLWHQHLYFGTDSLILLKRQNYFRQFLSAKLARKSDIWHSSTSMGCPKEPIEILPNKSWDGHSGFSIFEWFFDLDRSYDLIEKSMREGTWPVRVLTISYEEDVQRNVSEAYRKVCDFLGEPCLSVEPPLSKTVSDCSLRRLVKNLDEWQNLFANTKWAWMVRD